MFPYISPLAWQWYWFSGFSTLEGQGEKWTVRGALGEEDRGQIGAEWGQQTGDSMLTTGGQQVPSIWLKVGEKQTLLRYLKIPRIVRKELCFLWEKMCLLVVKISIAQRWLCLSFLLKVAYLLGTSGLISRRAKWPWRGFAAIFGGFLLLFTMVR